MLLCVEPRRFRCPAEYADIFWSHVKQLFLSGYLFLNRHNRKVRVARQLPRRFVLSCLKSRSAAKAREEAQSPRKLSRDSVNRLITPTNSYPNVLSSHLDHTANSHDINLQAWNRGSQIPEPLFIFTATCPLKSEPPRTPPPPHQSTLRPMTKTCVLKWYVSKTLVSTLSYLLYWGWGCSQGVSWKFKSPGGWANSSRLSFWTPAADHRRHWPR